MGVLRDNFADRIRLLRKINGLTQEQLAGKAGMDYKHLGSIERKEKNLTIDNIEKIAKGLNVEAYQLFLFSLENLKSEDEITEDKIIDLLKLFDSRIKKLILNIIQSIWKIFH